MHKQLWQGHTMTCWLMLQHGWALNTSCRESACQCRDVGSIPGSGRSLGGGNGNPLKYPCLENAMDRGAWQAAVESEPKQVGETGDRRPHTVLVPVRPVYRTGKSREQRRRVLARGAQKWLLVDKQFLLGWWKGGELAGGGDYAALWVHWDLLGYIPYIVGILKPTRLYTIGRIA